jgi:RNA polymerase sigma factor (sigma-70 family)
VTEKKTARESTWSNERLVRECRKGNQAAWSALIEKYKNLIFSVPIKFGVPRDEAADIFQAVCLDLLASLSQLREPAALPKWLMQMSYHKCLRWKKQQLGLAEDPDELQEQPDDAMPPEELIHQLQRAQILRDSVAALPERCRRMVQLLFFEEPPRPYEEIAKELGLATGSIGFIRGRCLKKLQDRLREEGLR